MGALKITKRRVCIYDDYGTLVCQSDLRNSEEEAHKLFGSFTMVNGKVRLNKISMDYDSMIIENETTEAER